MPTQPSVRSPKCTLPSRPPVMPPSRPMYWAKMRAGVTPRMRCAARSRCRTQRRSCAVHGPGRAGRDRLLAEAVVEGAGHLALPVEGHRPLLDAAHGEHRPQEPDAVLGRQVLRHECRDVGPRLSRFRRHLVHLPFRLTGAPGIRRRALGLGGRAAGSPRRADRAGRRLPWAGWRTPTGSSASGRPGCAGGCAARGCGRRSSCSRRSRRVLSPCCRPTTARRARSSAARCSPASPTCSSSRSVAPLLARLLRRRRPDLPRMIATDFAGTALLLALAVALVVAGLVHRPAVRGRGAGPRARLRRDARLRARAGARVRRGARRGGRRCASPRTSSASACRAREPDRPLCLFVDTDRHPAAVRRDDSTEPNSALRTVGGFD